MNAVARVISISCEAPLRVCERGRWFQRPNGVRVDCHHRPRLVKLLERLARARVDAPGLTVSVPELIALMWPGEELTLDVALNRLRVAITTLRNLGLGDMLLKDSGGYRLATSTDFELVVGMNQRGPTFGSTVRVVYSAP